MKRTKIDYRDLNSRAQENYNFAKAAGLLADYGYTCLRLSDDWNGADFIALHNDGDSLGVQLKGRWHVDSKYLGKDLWLAFPANGYWYLIEHDVLCERLAEVSPETKPMQSYRRGEPFGRSSGYLPGKLFEALKDYQIGEDTRVGKH